MTRRSFTTITVDLNVSQSLEHSQNAIFNSLLLIYATNFCDKNLTLIKHSGPEQLSHKDAHLRPPAVVS